MRLIFLILFLISSSFALSIDKTWYENKKEESSKTIIDKIKSMRDNVFSNDKSPIHKI